MKVGKYKYDYRIISLKLSEEEYQAFQNIVEEFNFNRSKLLRQLVKKFINEYQNEKIFFNKKTKNLTYL